ncbi:hypothetical protein Mapa_004839 [Marchantia paleacea]|nr:hypothetical protein Mapa_004839 [Marchantia paleacea]
MRGHSSVEGPSLTPTDLVSISSRRRRMRQDCGDVAHGCDVVNFQKLKLSPVDQFQICGRQEKTGTKVSPKMQASFLRNICRATFSERDCKLHPFVDFNLLWFRMPVVDALVEGS